LNASLEASTRPSFFTLFQDSFSEEVWNTTYKDHQDKDINDSFWRVACAIASVEITEELRKKWTENFYEMMINFHCVPGGRILANAGTEFKGTSLINCFVSPSPAFDADSMVGILQTLKAQTLTLKSEGGWGNNFSVLRPRGSFINGIGVESPGAVKFMELFDKSSEIITSGSGSKSLNKKAKGKIRKGAMMGVLDCLGGNTPINTIEGKKPIKELVGTKPYLYCTDGEGNVYVRQAELVWSKGSRKTIRVVFDNDDFIDCTAEHEFMLTDGTYKKAQDLQMSDSLSALNKRMLNNYLHLGITGSRKLIAEHNAVYEMMYGEYPSCLGSKKRTGTDTIAHHMDEVKWNNHPENIQRMTVKEHSIHHSDLLKQMQKDRAQKMKGTTWTEFYGTEKAEDIRKKYTSKRKGTIPWNKGLVFSKDNTNHKVVRIEEGIEQEVFDIAMPEYHNFCANGVFVHNCWHPDIVEFITAKQTSNRLQKFNVSVNCVDAFMEKVLQVYEWKKAGVEQELVDEITWDLIFPETTHKQYKAEWKGDIVDWQEKGYPVTVYKTLKVEWLWNLITQSTYNRNEPGILFLDRSNKFNQLNYLEKIASTNPCGEQMLSPGGICCLGTLNLTQFVNKTHTGFDLTKVKKYVKYLVRFLDNVNAYSDAPLPEYVEAMRKKRRIGCGLMGWGSALYMMQVRFGSAKADEVRAELLKAFTHAGVAASIELAEEKGMFEFCDPEKHVISPYWDNIDLPKSLRERMRKSGIRNSSLFSMQPNGNSSIFANIVSGGIEPIFLHGYIRTIIVADMPAHIADVTPIWYQGEWYETEMFKFAEEGDEQILRGVDKHGVVYKIDKNRGLTKEVLCEDYGVRFLKSLGLWDATADWAVTTDTLSVNEHVSDLKGFAKAVDSACSKTVNLPNDYSFEAFQGIYLDAYKTGFIKGLTTYRAGSMTAVLSAADQKNNTDEEVIISDIKMPDTSSAEVKVLRDHEGGSSRKWYVTVTLNENKAPIALFVQTNAMEKTVTTNDALERLLAMARTKGIPEKYVAGVEEKFQHDSNSTKIARTIGLLLRHGVRIKNIVAEIDKIEGVTFASFLFHLKKLLGGYIKDGEKIAGATCSNCGSSQMVYESGCSKCLQCGGSKCS
jgi:ribonucleoside-diphosphate reductase alpha chain